MRDAIFLLLVGAGALIFQTTMTGVSDYMPLKPDLVLVTVVWAGVRVDLTSGSIYAFVIGIVMDTFSGSYNGLSSIIYCSAFVVSSFYHGVFMVDTALGSLFSMFIAALISGILNGIVLLTFDSVSFSPIMVLWILTKTFLTTIASLLVFPVVDNMYKTYTKILGIA